MAKQQNQNDQPAKARIGSIGENLVVAKLMQQGWDAFNANCTIKNYKSIDIVCLDSNSKESNEHWWKPKTSLVQVKTSVENTIPAGFSIEDSLNKDYLEKMVKGPYVFVSATKEDFSFRFFILSRHQFIELLHNAYVFYDKTHSSQEEKSAPACLYVSWLEGGTFFSPRFQEEFGNPIKESCENKWENIWKE